MARKTDPDTSEIRKNQILDAATSVFARLGFEHARMDDIVEASGLSKGTLYWYFKSKEEIITAILHRLFVTDIEQLRGLLDVEATVSQRLLLLTHYRITGLKHIAHLIPILIEFYAITGREDRVRHFISAYFRDFRTLLVDLIQQGIDTGEFRPVSTIETAVTISAIYEGLMLHWLIDPTVIDWDIISEGAVQLLLEGIKQNKRDIGKGMNSP